MLRFSCKFLVLYASLFLFHTAYAATITVNSDADDENQAVGTCTLRDAVASINNGGDTGGCEADVSVNGYASDDTILFDPTLAGSTIHVADGGQIVITKSVVIDGEDNDITLDAQPFGGGVANNRILQVPDGNDAALTVRGLTFINGVMTGDLSETAGGSIFYGDESGQQLLVERCVFRNNASGGSGGGAIDAYLGTIRESLFENNSTAGPGGALALRTGTILDSTFQRNIIATAMFTFGGGAVYGQSLIIANSTFVNNSADNSTFGGGAINAAKLDISNSTFLANSALDTVFDNGGGAIAVSGNRSSMTARHLTLVNNVASAGESMAIYAGNSTPIDIGNSLIVSTDAITGTEAHCAGAGIITGSYNLEWTEGHGSAVSCGNTNSVDAGTIASIDQIVSTVLADSSGPTQTLALPASSPAIGAADPAGSGTSQMLDETGTWVDATEDQRGEIRKAVDAGRDLGAYETYSLLMTGDPPDGVVNDAYDDSSINVTGGVSPYQYTISNGVLPPGLALAPSTGEITGTPTQTGSYTFTVSATDNANFKTSAEFTIVIHARALPATPVPVLPVPLIIVLAGLLLGAARMYRQRGY